MAFILFIALLMGIAYGLHLGMRRPLPQAVAVIGRLLTMMPMATIAWQLPVMGKGDAFAKLAMVVVVGGWLVMLTRGRIIKPGCDPKTVHLVPVTPDKQSVIMTIAVAVMLIFVTALQWTTVRLDIRENGVDVGSLAVFVMSMACWAIVIACAMLPWRLHRGWTVRTLLLVGIAMLVYLPLAWLTSGHDAVQNTTMMGYPSSMGRDPFEHALTGAATTSGRATFAGTGPVIATNLLAVLATVMTIMRYVLSRTIGFRDEDDESPLPGETTRKESE